MRKAQTACTVQRPMSHRAPESTAEGVVPKLFGVRSSRAPSGVGPIRAMRASPGMKKSHWSQSQMSVIAG